MQESNRENNAHVLGVVNRASTFGLFIRRIVLAFNQLMFDGVGRLYDSIVQFRDGTNDNELNGQQYINIKSVEKFIFQEAQKIERTFHVY